MDDNWIKIYRNLQDWEWYSDSHMVHLLIHLLINAEIDDVTWKGRTIKRGQIVASRSALSRDTGISERTIRTCLQRLVKGNDISIETNKLYSVISVLNFDYYTNVKEEPPKHEQPKPKEAKPKPKKKPNTLKDTLPDRKKNFYNSLIPFLEKYDKRMIRAFFDYWSETNKSQTKMRFELQQTWETSRRLATWASKDNNFSRNENETNRTAEQRQNDAANLVNKFLHQEK